MAVDELLKKEFDIYRVKQEGHPLMIENGSNAVPVRLLSFSVLRPLSVPKTPRKCRLKGQ